MTEQVPEPPPPSDPQAFGNGLEAGARPSIPPAEVVRAVPLERGELQRPTIDVQAQSQAVPAAQPAAPIAVTPAPSVAAPAPQPATVACSAPAPEAAATQAAPMHASQTYGSTSSAQSSSAGYAGAGVPHSAPLGAAVAVRPSRVWVALCHLAYLIPGFIPGLIVTTIVWIWRRERDPDVEDQGREALNMQLNFWLLSLLLGLTFLGLPLAVFVWFVGAILCIVATVHAAGGERYRYRYIFRIIT